MLLIRFEMCTQEAKHNRIIDLLDAHTNQKEIANSIGVIERTVQHIQYAKKLGRGTEISWQWGPPQEEKQNFTQDSQGQNHGGSYN